MLKPSLCCISINLSNAGHKFQSMTRKKYLLTEQTSALNMIIEKTINNLKVIKETILYCHRNGWNYRIGSDVIPLATLPEFMSFDGLNQVFDDCRVNLLCDEISNTIKTTGIRCSMHPDQFVVPASANPNTVINSIHMLEYHAIIMNHFGVYLSHIKHQ